MRTTNFLNVLKVKMRGHLAIQLGWIIGVLCILHGNSAFATSGVTYQGRLINPNGTPVSSATVQFRLQIRTPGAEDCLLYEEIQTHDLSASNGTFAISLNDGTGVRQDTNTWNLFESLSNRKAFSFSASDCTGPNTYIPSAIDNRRFRVMFNDGTFAGWEALPIQTINFIPMSIETYAVGGFPASSLLRVENAGVLGAAAPLTTAQYNEILALVNGTSTQYSGVNELNGSALPAIGSGQSVRWDGSAWEAYTPPTNASLPTCTAGQVLTSNGTALSCVASLSSIDGDDITSGTIGGTTAWNTSGNITTSGTVTAGNVTTSGTVTATNVSATTTSTQNLRIFESTNTNHVSIIAPATFTDYVLTLPVDDGGSGQVLSTDGSGVLSWITAGTPNVNLSNIRSTINPLGHVFPSTACDLDQTLRYNGTTDAYECSDVEVAQAGLPDEVVLDGGNTSGAMVVVGTNDVQHFQLETSGLARMTVLATGNVGVGTTNPATKFAVDGTIKIADGLEGCAAVGDGGMIRYSGTSLQFCNGTAWQTLGISGAGITNINGLTDGTQNFAIGATGNAPAFVSGSGTHTLNIPLASAGGTVTAGLLSNAEYAALNSKLDSVDGSTLNDGLIWVGDGSNVAAAVAMSGDATLANDGALTLKNTGTAGTYTKVTTDAQGRVTAGAALAASDMPDEVILDGGNTTGAAVVVGTNDAQSLQLETNNSPKMTILSGGNVGIGTDNPASLLDVQAMAATTATTFGDYPGIGVKNTLVTQGNGFSTYNRSALRTSSGNGTVSGDLLTTYESAGFGSALHLRSITNHPLVFHTNATERMRLSATGNLGVGTTNPATKFEVGGSIKIADGAETCAAGTDGGMIRYSGTDLQFCNGTAWQTLGISGSGVTSLNGLTNGTQTFAIGATGNAPAFVSATGTHTLNIPLASASGTVTAGLLSNAEYAALNAKLDAVAGSTLNDGLMWVGDDSNQAVAVAMSGDATLANDGALTLKNTGAAGTYTKVTTDAQGRVTAGAALAASDMPDEVILDDGNTTGATVIVGTNDAQSLQLETNGSPRLTVLSGGNVGIGTATPGTPLEVNGTIRSSASEPLFSAVDNSNARTSPNMTGGLEIRDNANALSGYLAFETGDSNTDLYLGVNTGAGNGGLRMQTAGSDRMYISYAGLVGIGTDAPDTRLEVSGTIKIADGGETCSAVANGGMIRYSGTALQYCNGTAWQTLGISGSGITSLNGLTGGTQTFAIGTSGLVPDFDSTGTTHTLNIPMADAAGVTAGLLSKAKYDEFDAKLDSVAGSALNDGQIFVGNVSNEAAAVSVSGDVSMTNAGVTEVVAIRGIAVDGTDPTAAGQVLKYDGTSDYAPGFIGINDIRSTANSANNVFPLTCDASETLVHNSTTDQFSCTPIAIDAAQVANLPTGDILDGGNTTGAMVVVGTNDVQHFQLETSGLARMTVLATGNVGVGTTNPATKFEVGGSIKVADGAETCAAVGDGGMIRYSGTALQYCNGTAWQTLGISGSGITSLNGLTGGTQTFAIGATGDAPAFSSAGTVHTLNIPMASAGGTVTAGLLSNTEYAALNSKLDAVAGSTLNDGQIFVGDSSNDAAAVSVTGDVSLANTGATEVVAIRNIAVATGTPTDGQVLRSNGTSYAPSHLTVSDIRSAANMGVSVFPSACTAAQTMTWSALTDTFLCSDISIAATQITGLNNGDIVDGGNTTGATVIVGTNDTQSFQLETDNNPRMTILSGGNVGIGTTNPTSTLTVGGPLTVNANTESIFRKVETEFYISPQYTDDTTGHVEIGAWDNVGTTGARNLILQPADGRVGIGTTAPSTLLDVDGAITSRPIGTGTGQTGQLLLHELAAGGTNSFTIRAPDSLSSDRVWTLPNSNGNSGYVLSTNGSGELSWTNPTNLNDDINIDGDLNIEDNLIVEGYGRFDSYVRTGDGSATSPGHSFVNDSNLGMYRVTTDTLGFSTAGSERMRIDDSGNVGIGTATPGRLLHVNGPMRLEAASLPITPGLGDVAIDSGDGNKLKWYDGLTWQAAGGSSGGSGDFLADGTVNMTGTLKAVPGTAALPGITFAGDTNTGINRPYGDAIGFSVAGINGYTMDQTGLYSEAFLINRVAGTAADPNYTFLNDNNTGMYGPGSDVLAFSTAGSERLRINSSGNVGIGTNNPTSKLDIRGSSSNSVSVNVTNSGSGSNSYSGFYAAGAASNAYLDMGIANSGANYYADEAYIEAGIGVDGLNIVASDPVKFLMSGDEALRITSSGNVGIGTTNPQSTLQVTGYAQLDTVTAAPPSADCDAAAEYGRMKVDTSAGSPKLYVCAADGWVAFMPAGANTCPTGWTRIGDAGKKGSYCIETDERTAASYMDARTTCQAINDSQYGRARLCRPTEWHMACVHGSGLSNMTNNWEWLDDFPDDPEGMTVGNGSCSTWQDDTISDTNNSYRCCM